MFIKDKLKISPSERTYSDEGFLQVPARICRTGVQTYLASEMGFTDMEPSCPVRVYRAADEVFKEDSLRSFSNKPVTNNHPLELVNAENFKKYAVGFSTGEVIEDGMFAKALLNINDADAIKLIESGKVELSNGYTCDIERKQGVTDEGDEYDCLQTNIKGNHIAIVDKGRAGHECRLADNSTINGVKSMSKMMIDGVDYEVNDQLKQAISKLEVKISDMEKEVSEKDEEAKTKEELAKEALAKLKAKEDEAKAKEDEAKEKEASTKDSIDGLVSDRVALIADALKIKSDYEWLGKDAETIRKELVADKKPELEMEGLSSDYIKARFDMLLENGTTDDLTSAFEKKAAVTKTDNKPTTSLSDAARHKFIERTQNAWKGETK